MALLMTLIAFIAALGVLIVIHEFGHYQVARWCGVKVLRFSVGFGRPLLTRRLGSDRTEWVISALPLGGYVKMLDEREGDVPDNERHRAFNRQSVYRRFAIVSAGPIANFLLAILVYWLLFVHGVPALKPELGHQPASTPAAMAQFQNGETIVRIGDEDVQTWQDVRWVLLEHAVARERVSVEVRDERDQVGVRTLDLSSLSADDLDGDFLTRIGLRRLLPVVVGAVQPDSAGARADLRVGDRIVGVNGVAVYNWDDLVAAITPQGGKEVELLVRRGELEQPLRLTPEPVERDGRVIGRIGVQPDVAMLEAQRTTVSYGPIEAVGRAALRTWEVSVLSLRMLGKMIMGEVSLKNLSGPITIADYAGQSAQLGWLPYISFIALISISLGVLNLLPVPLLDGGHLMYYLIEMVKGRPVSERAMEIGQRIGMVLLFTLMAFAIYNDINRLVGG
ncbi:MAG: RIP metalloprotease RseP [Burkholderiales bacterium]|nr:RIP metalloprotease RseP [Burkholderiales bacterium]